MMKVNGYYEGTGDDGETELALRVDVNGLEGVKTTTNRVSGDVFVVNRLNGHAWSDYRRSWEIESPLVSSRAPLELGGPATSSKTGESLSVRIRIPADGGAPGSAAVTVTYSSGESIRYSCQRKDDAFRRVTLEIDKCKSLGSFPEPRVELATGSNGDKRLITLLSAYADAGVAVHLTGDAENEKNAVDDVMKDGKTVEWTDADLDHALTNYFEGNAAARSGERFQWCVWGLLAGAYKDDATTAGVMFDIRSRKRDGVTDPSRQGFAVFRKNRWFDDLASRDEAARLLSESRYLLAWVHEMGHTFNLVHTKLRGIPASEPTWMMYEDEFRGRNGQTFWNTFDYKFHDRELVHLRHGFLHEVAVGGDDFLFAQYLKTGLGGELPREHRSVFSGTGSAPLELLLRSRSYFDFREPLMIEARLCNRSKQPLDINASLEPENNGLVVFIRRPDGRVTTYEPLIRRLVPAKMRTLAGAGAEGSDRLSAPLNLTFGRDGFYFDTPGEYRLRAVYRLADATILSNALRVRVGYPSREVDRQAQNFFTDDVGWALYLGGSRSPYLEKGFKELERLAREEETASTPLGVLLASSIAKGVGAPFHETDKKRVTRKEGKPGEAVTLTQKAYDFFRDLPNRYPNVADQKHFNLAYAGLVRRRAEFLRVAGGPDAAGREVNELLDDLEKRDVHAPVREELRTELTKVGENYVSS